jgi:hypothetical protein
VDVAGSGDPSDGVLGVSCSILAPRAMHFSARSECDVTTVARMPFTHSPSDAVTVVQCRRSAFTTP